MYDWEEKPDLNVTPLVDVMLVLLTILMVTTPVVLYEENITLPSGSITKAINKLPKIEIRIDVNRNIKIKKSKYTFSNFTDNFVLYSQNLDKKTPVYIRADRKLLYNDVIYILKSVKEAGFTKVSLITDV